MFQWLRFSGYKRDTESIRRKHIEREEMMKSNNILILRKTLL